MGRRGKDLTPSVKATNSKLHKQDYSGRKIAELLKINSSTVKKCLKTFETS